MAGSRTYGRMGRRKINVALVHPYHEGKSFFVKFGPVV